VKVPVRDEADERIPSDLPSRQGSRAAERPAPASRKEKKVLRELRWSNEERMSRYRY
jgi:hypothetical protein